MHRKEKYLFLILILFLTILINLILIRSPINYGFNKNLFYYFPFLYWIIIIIIPIISVIIILRTKKYYVNIVILVVYIFIIYSNNFFYRSFPTHSDIGFLGSITNHLFNSIYIDPSVYYYFEWPLFFHLEVVFHLFLKTNSTTTINIGFFILLIIIIFITINITNNFILKNKKYYILYPILLMILIFYTINSQFVPQFLGLLYLLSTISFYYQYKLSNNIIFYILLIMSYIACIYTHPFIFIFFPMSILLENIYTFYKKIQKTKLSINHKYTYYIKDFYKIKGNNISFLLLLIIYIQAFYFKFNSIRPYFFELISYDIGYGKSFSLLYKLFRIEPPTSDINQVNVSPYPLYNLISEDIYLLSRYSMLILYGFLIILLAYSLILIFNRNFIHNYKINRNYERPLNKFNISLIINTILFYLLGLVKPSILGMRSLQIFFIPFVQYYKIIFMKKLLLYVVLVIIIIFPTLVIINYTINDTINGTRFIEDDETIMTGIFFVKNYENEYIVLTPERSYTPYHNQDVISNDTYTMVTPYTIAENETMKNEINAIIYSPKLSNGLNLYNIQLNTKNNSYIYDIGDTGIYVY